MKLTDLIQIVETLEIDKLRTLLQASKDAYFITECLGLKERIGREYDRKQYNPKMHEIFNQATRPDKTVKDENENASIVKVSRISIAEQQRIVFLAASFLGIPELYATPNGAAETDMLSVLKRVHDDNKMNYVFREVMERTMSERECAEIWYPVSADKTFWDNSPIAGNERRTKVRLISPELGDELLPVFDEYGDMVAFGRYYKLNVVGVSTATATEEERFVLYTPGRVYEAKKEKSGSSWEFMTSGVDITQDNGEVVVPKYFPAPNKIPVIYYRQPTTEWSDVQEMIERLETLISNLADTNDYTGSPILLATGKIASFAKKGEAGKLIEMEEGGKLEYINLSTAPESIKTEIEFLVSQINIQTHSIDISLKALSGIGAPSGFALKMLFMDAHMKAASKEKIFGIGVQRRLNLLKFMYGVSIAPAKLSGGMSLVVKPKFNYFLPKDIDGEVSTVVKAYQGGIISLETAVSLNPLVADAVKELKKIKDEKTAAAPAQ